MSEPLRAFRAADFNWTRDLQSVWTDSSFQVDELHNDVVDELMEVFVSRTRNTTDNPIGRVILGQAGAGKTHLIGRLRQRVWDADGWFVLLDILGITDFWATAALGFVDSLHQPMPNGRAQYETILSTIARQLPLDATARQAIEHWEQKREPEKLRTTDLFIRLLSRADPAKTLRHQDVVRALLLLESEDWNAKNLAYCWLQGLDASESERKELGFLNAPPPFPELVRGMLWVMSLAGPVLIAVDQIDAIVSASNLLAGMDEEPKDDGERKARSIIDLLAGGLMDLHDLKRRALTVVSCLEVTWPIIKARAVKSANHRFQEVTALEPINDRSIVERIIRGRLDAAYSEHGFEPPYPTWPFRAEAIDGATGLLPRRILMRCDEHQRNCRAAGTVTECLSLIERSSPPIQPQQNGFDAEFREHIQSANIDGLLDQQIEDTLFCDLLNDATAIYARQLETPDDIEVQIRPDPDRSKPSLHARLTFTFRSEGDREQHYCFRAIGHTNATAFQARLRAAMTATGIDRSLGFRHLFILRRGPPPGGPKTAALVDKFKDAGGCFIAPTDEDLRAFVALRTMLQSNRDGFDAWLRKRKPLFETPLFRAASLCPPSFLRPSPDPDGRARKSRPPDPDPGMQLSRPDTPPPPAAAVPQAQAASDTEAPPREAGGRESRSKPKPAEPPTHPRVIPLGHRYERGAAGAAARLSAELLPRHVAILAGSGSGKTVLLRRIVEEAALIGIPAIVLDTNNDLARLGDSWPERPEGWTDADAAKAADYEQNVEVAIWTPGSSSGRPLSLALLPDFGALGNDPDERAQAVEMARATLAPFIGAAGAGAKLKEGVLADALRRFSREGGSTLGGFIDLLSDLPDEVSEIGNARKLASAIADQLRAAIATNPLMQSRGNPLDPHALFHGADNKIRISVINFAGLPSDEARQSFVNQLQMSLFTWIRRNPSPTGRLYVLDEAQNFAPSQRSTACKESTVSLAAQARKYGLGMIFATQAPKGIDNKIVSNCTTQFYGRMSAPATIEATRELMAAKGGGGEDIGRLTRGEFYFSTEGTGRPMKIRTPLCLTWHPPNPLPAEEVVAKARRSTE
jgi:DNA helicase HerA-like ATPase